jgi:hypothetical protein
MWCGALIAPMILCVVDTPKAPATTADINALWCRRINANMPHLYFVVARTPKMAIHFVV